MFGVVDMVIFWSIPMTASIVKIVIFTVLKVTLGF